MGGGEGGDTVTDYCAYANSPVRLEGSILVFYISDYTSQNTL